MWILLAQVCQEIIISTYFLYYDGREECEINGLQIKHSLDSGSKVRLGQTQNWTWILETSKPAKTKFITFSSHTTQQQQRN